MAVAARRRRPGSAAWPPRRTTAPDRNQATDSCRFRNVSRRHPSITVDGVTSPLNLGVEFGQLAVLSVALPLVLTVRNAAWFGDRGVKALSVAIALAGAALFVARLAGR
jgi:hypothetical protein